ncbi:proline racemase [Rhizobium leguminosarum bv. trifolii WSM597]|uniref:Proline racemase n=1 Tax=Rhizobium leguminosarum bv. trifolii WSM597 TaxID=754764 RepID=I9NJH5_RHILT|nr:proline racemase family protein [Rhizobium leguminosarum]EJB06872.1 proline racemase [Rhizobium leguminosarum bv. trifolii WSM597]
MRFKKVLSVVDCHAEGESGKVIVGGVGKVKSETMFDKRTYIETYPPDPYQQEFTVADTWMTTV